MRFDPQSMSLVHAPLQGSYSIEVITLSTQNILEKKVKLQITPRVSGSTLVTPSGGPLQRYGVDYFVNGDELIWDGMGLDGVLEVNDFLICQY